MLKLFANLSLKTLYSARHEKYSKRVEKNKKFKDFLTKVIELLPDSKYAPEKINYYAIVMSYLMHK